MHALLTRHAVQVLIAAGHKQEDVARQLGLSTRSIRRILTEGAVNHVDDAAERRARKVGRPSKVAAVQQHVQELLVANPDMMTLEILRRVRERGYTGEKSALYQLVAAMRPPRQRLEMRFEGVPGEFSQHDFGEVDVRYADGTRERIHFFASRLKWSRWVQVTVVPDQTAETLVRTLLDHFVAWGGVPLCAVFDRPKTVALSWRGDGSITEWNPVFAQAAMEIGFTAEVCWAYSPEQKGAVEAVVKWVKGSFFKPRRFHDREDLLQQLAAWHHEANMQRPSRATDVIPEERMAQEERRRLRPPRVGVDELALRIPITVGPTAYVVHDTHPYSMPPRAAGLSGTLYLYRNQVRIVAGRHEAIHERKFARKQVSTLPEHRALQLAEISGQRGRRYLKREHLFQTGESAVRFITDLVHRDPLGWIREVDKLHQLLDRHGAQAMDLAFRAAVDIGRIEVSYVEKLLTTTSLHPTLSLETSA